ncbi:MAG: methyltransferase [Candidatus Riflebacteria bacterium]|nr:methyltransferase [Candidatus Riflebacteria bacterium]
MPATSNFNHTKNHANGSLLIDDPELDTDERLDTLVGTPYRLIQKIDGTAFAIDTLLLAWFASLPPKGGRVVDLGSGSGVLSFMIKARRPDLEIVGIEIQEEFYELSLRNTRLNRSVTGLAFERLDVRDIPSKLLPDSFDLVVSNPPYYPLGSGKLPPKGTRAAARHELSGTLRDFIEGATYLLSYGSRLALVTPAGRFFEASEIFKTVQMGLRRLQFVMPKEGEPAHLALVEVERFYNGPHEALPSFPIHLADGGFSGIVDDLFKRGLHT